MVISHAYYSNHEDNPLFSLTMFLLSPTFAFSNPRLEFIPNRRLVESFSFYRKLTADSRDVWKYKYYAMKYNI